MTLRLHIVCSDFRSFGSGHDAATWRLAQALGRRADVETTVITGRCRGEIPAGVRVVKLPCIPIWRFSLLFLSFRAAWAVYRRFLPSDTVIYLSSPLWRGGDLAAVHFLSGRWRAERADAVGGWRTALRILHDRFRHGLAAFLENRVYRDVGADGRPFLLPVGAVLARDLTEFHAVPLPAMEVVPNIVDTETFRPGAEPELRRSICAAAGWSEDVRIVLFVGGAWHRKRPDRAVEALCFLPEHVVLLVVGPGPQADLYDQSRRHGVAHRLHMTGAVKDVARMYRIATVLVLPSDYETDGLVALEAMASGVPVVAAPCRGSDGWLIKGRTGLSGRSSEEIADAVRWLMDNPQETVAMGRAGRALAKGRCPTTIAARVVGLARQVLDQRSRA